MRLVLLERTISLPFSPQNIIRFIISKPRALRPH
jgi:hypothetical protein